MAIAISSLFAVSITASSLIDPPGWITDFMPACPRSSTLSGNGKKPSEAAMAPFALFPALSRAILVAPFRFLKLPTPRVQKWVSWPFSYRPFPMTMPFDSTFRTTSHAARSFAVSASLGRSLVGYSRLWAFIFLW